MENIKYFKTLEKDLERLNQTAKKLVATRGYTAEVESIKMLEELIKEQLKNENMRSSASSPR